MAHTAPMYTYLPTRQVGRMVSSEDGAFNGRVIRVVQRTQSEGATTTSASSSSSTSSSTELALVLSSDGGGGGSQIVGSVGVTGGQRIYELDTSKSTLKINQDLSHHTASFQVRTPPRAVTTTASLSRHHCAVAPPRLPLSRCAHCAHCAIAPPPPSSSTLFPTILRPRPYAGGHAR
jgi:hypothetical protein